MPAHPSLSPSELESICKVLADTGDGLTGSEIGALLVQLGIADPCPTLTKWKRLSAALGERQQKDNCANNVFAFILEAMKPVRYTSNQVVFENRRRHLNHVLVLIGYAMDEEGQLRSCQPAKTLTEAEKRAGHLRSELNKRNVHADVLRFCRAELLQNNYFHAVLEATKSVGDKLRVKTGLTEDGAELADKALALGKVGMPFLAFNTLQTDSEHSEQNGLLHLMKGLFGTFRNPAAHAPKISWNMTEQDALDLLTMASFLHRRLDTAIRTPRTT